MKYTVEKTEKYVLFQLHEEKLTSITAPDLKTELVTLNAEGFNNIILNMTDVKYADSSGLSSILIGNRVCNNSGGLFVMCNVNDHVMKLLKISQLDTILTLLPTVEEGIDAVFLHEIQGDLEDEESAE
ncbi:STAS domain-containing protein [Cytophaga hutchinsonii]|jgi:anti-sigma B factor antagonist|uniref:Anti-sigma factor antagonist n=1 Tax=Cytophaga hutchinsonii (strain ATCC 33406 / DSM 1761 / CIP 103989 / NBRC 15051 / NCIMB 9469 / D465) TaxID=269798 RepID=A0A6N4SS96_CYTH3|nr:anti-anti-sigma regulatory factor (antagonist of anti-sigma factor) [Cytophaga hutchinsonii ATCC 33406]SFX34839.1 anti-anti-sigma factor [Cytophaga hutchinsonii ATCC 33406]